MNKIIIMGTAIWLFMALFTAGSLNADFRGNFPNNYKDEKWAREGCSHWLGVGLFSGPIGFLMSPFVTGFFQHGWTLSCSPTEYEK